MKKIGAWASIICAIHCTILPLIVIILPTAGVYLFVNELFEFIVLGISLIFNITNVCFSYRQHKSNKAVSTLAVGLFLFVIGRLLHHHNHEQTGLQFDLFNLFMILGGLLMAASSFINDKLCSHCHTCETKHER